MVKAKLKVDTSIVVGQHVLDSTLHLLTGQSWTVQSSNCFVEGRPCGNTVTHMQTGVRPLSCHHPPNSRPKSRLTHQAGSQQMHCQLLEPVGHFSAGLGL